MDDKVLTEEQKKEQDHKFLIDIFFQIRDYARNNDMEEDETIRRIAISMLQLLEIATFNSREDE